MYSVLDKDTIEMEIVPYIPKSKRGFPPSVPLTELINAILYKLKTGVQWKYLPVKALFSELSLSWQSVYYHFRKWCLSEVWQNIWVKLLQKHGKDLDLSSVDLDGSHTPAIRGGQEVEYQGRKKRKTTNALYLTDRQGLPLAMSEPVAGNHNDLYNIEVQFEVVTATLEKDFRESCSKKDINANICFNKRNGNVDRDEYFDKELYDQRYAVERTNAWMDSFRSLLNRFDTTTESWKGFNYLAFTSIALKKFKKKQNIKV